MIALIALWNVGKKYEGWCVWTDEREIPWDLIWVVLI